MSLDPARLVFTGPDAPPVPGATRVRELTSLQWWQARPRAERYQLDAFPTFDEGWVTWLACSSEPLPPELEALCHYAEDVRQGRLVDRVEPEQALQAIWLAMVQEQREPAQLTSSIDAFFAHVCAQLQAGAPLATTRFFADAPRFQRYIAALADDLRLYREDVARGQQWRLTVGPRSVKLLALDRPASTQFKLWARRSDGCALLLVRQSDGLLVLSADPSAKLKVDWAAPVLSRLDVHPWYAGERHHGTLIASSREGTRLGFDDVRRALKARVPTARAWLAVPVVVAVAALTAAIFRPPAQHPPEAAVSGAKGEPLQRAEVLELLGRPDGPRSFESYALIAGVCGYPEGHALTAPCRDARAVRALLVSRFGYRPENVTLLVDDDPSGPQPDAPGLKLAVERFRERHPQADANSSFLFYYSGHGGYEKGARRDYGVLQPAGYFEHPEAPVMSRGWDMERLFDDLRKGVPSKHVMVVLDACYSGWAVGAKGDASLSPALRTRWAERAEVVLTAGTRGQRAWEDDAEAPRWEGHSAFTAFLLQGLAEGDQNGDGVVTDEELAAWVKQRVPPAVRDEKRADQTPQFFRLDETLPKSGQFLFVRSP